MFVFAPSLGLMSQRIPIILPPIKNNFKEDGKENNNYLHEGIPINWPESNYKTAPRTKSYINLATTISGLGNSFQSLHVDYEKKFPEIDYLQLILQASTRVYDIAIETPLQYAKNLSSKIGRGNKIYFKREDLQPSCFSFKSRGAYNKICQLTKEERDRGVICMSAGNHAQGVSLACQKLNIKATIVMPSSAPEIKILNVRKMGATVILYGDDLEEAKQECIRLSHEHGYIFIPPFDDPYIIAGQGTVGMEIVKQIRRGDRLDAIFCPIGGGGLISGIAAFIKRIFPDIKVIGVNTVDSHAMATSLQAGHNIEAQHVGRFADGTAVKHVGDETFRLCGKLLDDIVIVSVDEICSAIKDVFEDTRSILEPSGARM